MFIRFDNKYSPCPFSLSRSRLIFFQQTLWIIWILLAISTRINAQENFHWKCITATKDSLVFPDQYEAESFMRDQLDIAFRQSYATAHWKLVQLDTIQRVVIYQFNLGKEIFKGQIKGFDPSIIDVGTLSALLFWKTNTRYNATTIDEGTRNELKSRGIDLTYHQIFFTDTVADLRLNLQKIPRNQFQGLLGTLNQENRTILIGDIQSQWVNSFKRAEKFFFHWQRQSISIQKLECEVEVPVIYKTSIGLQNKIELYRNQNIYFIMGATGSLNLRASQSALLQAKYEAKNHNALIQSQTIQHRLVGIGVIQKPKTWKGLILQLDLAFLRGFKNTIDTEGEIKKPIIKSDINIMIEKNWKRFFSSITFHQRGIYLQNEIANIEKIRLGGVETVRGFGQESIFCRNYAGNQLETGWNYSPAGRFFIFYDQAWIQQDTAPLEYWQGLGMGGVFQVPDGQIEVSSGWGIPQGAKFDLRNNLIHIQYQVYF